MTSELKPLIVSESGKSVVVKPKIVVEIAYEEIQKSPTYSSGYALRFPRVKRLRSMERSASDITTLAEIEKLYGKQKKS
jgi:DNA ligase-1